MADIASMLIQGATQTAQQSGEQLQSGIKTGAALAEQVERTQQMRQQMEQQKQQLQLQKVDKLTGLMEKGAAIKSKAARNAFFKNYIPKTAAALGLQDFIPEDTMMMIQADPEQAKKIALLRAQIREGKISMDDAVSKLDPEEFAMMDETEIAQLEAADKFRVDNDAKMGRAKYVAGEAGARASDARGEAGAVEEAKKVADQKVIWEAGGGEASADKAIGVFQAAIEKLKSNKVKFGTFAKNLPYAASEDVLARTDPAAKALLDDVRGGINIRLKTGDPNPTQNQIDQIMARAVDPRLGNEANIKKLETEIAAMQKDKENKLRTFYGKDPGTKKKRFEDLSPEAQAIIRAKQAGGKK